MPEKGNWHEDMRQGSRAKRDLYWWNHGVKKDAAQLQRLTSDFQLLSQDNQRIHAFETYASLYTNRRIDPGSPLLANYEANWYVKKGKYSRAPYNLMKIVIDECASRITKSRPAAKFMTYGGNRDAQRKAEMMERWNKGEIDKLRQDELFDLVVKDACQYGLGALKHMKSYRESRLQTLRVYPGNLFVDLEETLFEKPRRLHHRRFVSKTQLAAMFPKFRSEIQDSDHVSEESRYVSWYGHYLGAQDQCELVESWHLPTFIDENGNSPDGIRVLWIERAILQISVYNRRNFPFSFFNWKTDPHNTFYGIGLGEDLLGVHVDANVTLNRVNNAIEKIANPHILVKQGTQVSKAQITNAAGAIYEYSGNTPPEVILPNVVPGDLLAYVRDHLGRAYQIAGLTSGAAAAGGANLNSAQTGRAVENIMAAESVPFNEQLRKYENFVKHVAENNIACGREIYELDKSYSVVLPGEKNTIEELDWSEVALDPAEHKYVIRVTPTSSLPETPAARLAMIERFQAMGMVSDPSELRELQNIPDFEKMEDHANAASRLIDKMIGDAIDHNVFTPPRPNMDLRLFIIRASQAEQKAYDYDVEEVNIATLRRMARRAEELLQRQQQAQMAQQEGLIMPTQSVQQPETGVAPNAIQAAPGQ